MNSAVLYWDQIYSVVGNTMCALFLLFVLVWPWAVCILNDSVYDVG